MPISLNRTSVSDKERNENNKHNIFIVVSVLFTLLIYSYLFTHLYQEFSIPSPQNIAFSIGISDSDIFGSDGNIDCNLVIIWSKIFNPDDERFIVFVVMALCFLTVYYSPVKYKRQIMVFWFFVGFYFLYGLRVTSALVVGHLLVYLTFHPQNKHSNLLSYFWGLFLFLAFFPLYDLVFLNILNFIGCGVFAYLIFVKIYKPSLAINKVARISRILVIQGPILFSVLAAILNKFTGAVWVIPLGLLMFFHQWERLMVYHVDYKNDEVPLNLSFGIYLSIFLSPAIFTKWASNPYIGQGYTYMTSRFLSRDKNKIVLAGLKLWGFALFYLLIGDSVVQFVINFFSENFNVIVYSYVSQLVRNYVHGTEVGTATVLASTFLDQVRFFLLIASVVHFKVGAWRIFGFDMDPQYNKPWLATNLSNFWTRYAFHFREFLSKVFYYPIFLKYFRNDFTLRLFTAIIASATLGNLFWGHVPLSLWTKGLSWNVLILRLEAWPYYLLLGLSIFFTDLYLIKRKSRRKSWTFDKWIWTDFIAVYLTIQFFALIHVFARPHIDGNLADYTNLFLIGLGLK